MPNSQVRTNARRREFLVALTKPRGDRNWDLFLRTTAIVGLISIPITLFWAQAVPLVCFGLLTVPANSVVAAVVPVFFEALILEASKYTSPLGITLVGTAVFVLMEFLNLRIYGWILQNTPASRLSKYRWVRRSLEYFERAPFLTVALFPFTPLPFWAARIAAVLTKYPTARYLVATAIGRAPRIAAYAWLGHRLQLPSSVIAAIALAVVAIVVATRIARGARGGAKNQESIGELLKGLETARTTATSRAKMTPALEVEG